MKILVVSNMYPSPAAPSYGVFVRNFCMQLETLGIDYSLAVMKKRSGKLGKLLGYVEFYAKSFLCCLLGRYDLIYVHYASHSSQGVLLARKLRAFRIFTNCHGSDVIPQNAGQEKMQKYTRAILAHSERIIVPSEFFRRTVKEKYAIDSERIHVCASGGINTEIFHPSQEKKDDLFTVGFVSRLTPGKGWEVLLDACAGLPDREFRVLLVGDGPQRQKLEQRIGELGLAGQVRLFGMLPQEALPQIYSQLDVFVFPTELSESLGLVALEAMACGIPVIASDHAAPGDYVKDGMNGYKFPKGDAASLRQCLQRLRNLAEEDRNRLRTGALETAGEYTACAVTESLEKILRE